MFLLAFIPFWGRILAVLALVAAVWGHGVYFEHGRMKREVVAVQAAFELFKAETERLGKAQAEQTAKVIAQQEKANADVSKDYRDKLAALGRVRLPDIHPDGRPVAEVSCGPAGTPGTTPDAVPAAVSKADFDELKTLAAQTTLQVLGWQDWYREQQAAWR